MTEDKTKTKVSVFRAHKASFMLLSLTVVVAVFLFLSPAFATSSNPCGACHGTSYSQTLNINAGQVPPALDVGQTATVTAVVTNTVNAALNNVMTGVSVSLSSANGRFSVSTPDVIVGNLPQSSSSTVTWQITGVSAGQDTLLISANAVNSHMSLTFSDTYSPSLVVNVVAPVQTPTTTPTPTPTSTSTPTATPTPTPVPTTNPTPTSTPTPDQTTPIQKVTPTPTQNPAPTPTQTPDSTPNPTQTIALSPTPTPTNISPTSREEDQTDSEHDSISRWNDENSWLSQWPDINPWHSYWQHNPRFSDSNTSYKTEDSRTEDHKDNVEQSTASANVAGPSSWSLRAISGLPLIVPFAGLTLLIGKKLQLQPRERNKKIYRVENSVHNSF
jgi:hypothetical protein